MFPTVKDLPISKERKSYIISKFMSEFYASAIGRKVVNTKRVESVSDHRRLGFNLVLDRIWFVDYVGETGYAYQTLGTMEGKDVALAETKLILNKIIEKGNIVANRIETNAMDEENLDKYISSFNKRNLSCTAIVTSVHFMMNFWTFKKFKNTQSQGGKTLGFEGSYAGIPTYWSNFIPENMLLLINKNIGTLLISKELSADILDIDESDYELVLKNIPTLKRSDLPEKIRFIADELIRFDFENESAIMVVQQNASN